MGHKKSGYQFREQNVCQIEVIQKCFHKKHFHKYDMYNHRKIQITLTIYIFGDQFKSKQK